MYVYTLLCSDLIYMYYLDHAGVYSLLYYIVTELEILNFLGDETLQVSSALGVDYDGHHSR